MIVCIREYPSKDNYSFDVDIDPWGRCTITGFQITPKLVKELQVKGELLKLSVPATLNDNVVTQIADDVFKNCQYLGSVRLPDAVGDVGAGAFFGCVNLRYVTFGSDLRSIGDNAFYGCANLETVALPQTLTRLGNYVFANCVSLYRIIPLTEDASFQPDFGVSVFEGCRRLNPATLDPGLQEAYRASNIDEYRMLIPSGALEVVRSIFYDFNPTSENADETEQTWQASEELDDEYDSVFTGRQDVASAYKPFSFSLDDVNSFFIDANFVCSPQTEHNLFFFNSVPDGGFLCDSLLARVRISRGVVKVGACAFSDCASLREAIFEEGPEKIGDKAFKGCNSLEELVLPKSLKEIGAEAFANCQNLKSVCLPGDIKIAKDAFKGCKSLTTVRYSGSVVVKGTGIDTGCGFISQVVFGEGIKEIRKDAFLDGKQFKKIVLPLSLRKIGAKAFANCKNLEEIVFPQISVNQVGGQSGVANELIVAENAFIGCAGLKRLELPANFTVEDTVQGSEERIPYARIFADCDLLETVVFHEGFKKIGEKMFERCASLKSLDIPESLEEIGSQAFEKCSSLFDVSFKKGLKIGDSAFMGCSNLCEVVFKRGDSKKKFVVGAQAFEMCRNLKKVVLSDDFKGIGFHAFLGCGNLEEIVFSKNLETIDEGAFIGCGKLHKLNLPSKLTSIGKDVFSGCFKLDELEIPPSVTTIGSTTYVNGVGTSNEEPSKPPTHPFKVTTRLKVEMDCAAEKWADDFHHAYENPRIATSSLQTLDDDANSLVSDDGCWVYRIDSGGKAVCILGYRGNDARLEIPEKIAGRPVTSIADGPSPGPKGAFCGNLKITSATLPKTLKRIGHDAFYGCHELSSIELNEGLLSIGKSAFYDCKKLDGVVFPSTLKTIEVGAFHGCVGLKSLTLPDGMENLEEYAFSKCETLKKAVWSAGLKRIENGLFWGCYQLKKITGIENVVEIGKSAFQDCGTLSQFKFPILLESIGDGAFLGCRALEGLKLPQEKLSVIGEYAFALCDSIETAEIPSNVKRLEEYVFSFCHKLRKITLHEGIVHIGIGSFQEDVCLEEIVLPKSLEEINVYAFYGCTKLKEIEIPENVKRLSGGCFGNNSSLKKAILPRNLHTIDIGAFAGCDNLQELELPGDITYLGADFIPETTSIVVREDDSHEKAYKTKKTCRSNKVPFTIRSSSPPELR